MGVSNLDKTSEQVGFPVLEKRMAEFFDVSLEQPQFTLQSDCIGLQLCESSFDLLVEGNFIRSMFFRCSNTWKLPSSSHESSRKRRESDT
ncbi:hypothetical protein VN97_g8686 [Penicillium thymicola]|uniref:Uncharacterized protein n=1 Tax=Penicillium thymicola TaxID=293382 RepID=A0AAI9X5Y3_PENTH|nr:hypothetical protein VN97_g8686 [Penicillium thymicola]